MKEPTPLSREELARHERVAKMLIGTGQGDLVLRLVTTVRAREQERDRLRECLEPGKAPAILNAMFMEAERLGFYQSTAKHALTQFVEEVERLRRLLVERDGLLRGLMEALGVMAEVHGSLDGRPMLNRRELAINTLARAEAVLKPESMTPDTDVALTTGQLAEIGGVIEAALNPKETK